ncbi:MAG: hemolysin family protein [Sphingobacteriaceae bacterium]|jgi:CBS domain containing-hemolysin-like protein
MLFDIFLTLLLVVLNGFFVAAEFAIVKVRYSQVEIKAKTGNQSAKIAKHILQNLDGYLSATQLGITLASLGLGWIGESVVTEVILAALSLFGIAISPELAHQIALPVAFGTITILHIVFGELAPKSIAIQRPVTTTFALAIPLNIFYYIFRPFIWVLNGLANVILKKMGVSAIHGHEVHTSEELQLLLDQGKESGALDSSEHELIKNVFDFNDRTVKKIMVPRTAILAINIDSPYAEFVSAVINEGYTRMPVYKGNIDEIIGFIHVKDLLMKELKDQTVSLSDMIRPVYFIPESKKIADLLSEMRKKKNPHIAIVLDEFGGTAGLVTMEDIIEELVGEIQDEHDEEKPKVISINENEFIIDAHSAISDVNEFIPFPLPEQDEYDSVAGLMNVIFDKIPEIGEEIEFEGYHFTIIQKRKNNIESVKMRLVPKEDQSEN